MVGSMGVAFIDCCFYLGEYTGDLLILTNLTN